MNAMVVGVKHESAVELPVVVDGLEGQLVALVVEAVFANAKPGDQDVEQAVVAVA